MAQTVRNLPAIWETWVQSLGWEDPLEEGMATHSGILAWRIPWTEEPGGLQSMGSQRGPGNTTVNKINKVRPNRDCIPFGNVDYIDNNKLIEKYISTSESYMYSVKKKIKEVEKKDRKGERRECTAVG